MRYTVMYNNVRYKLNSYQTRCDTNDNVCLDSHSCCYSKYIALNVYYTRSL